MKEARGFIPLEELEDLSDEMARDLEAGIATALEVGTPVHIAVHNEVQARLGRIIAQRLAEERGMDPNLLDFVIVSEDMQRICWPGKIMELREI